jgi:lysozyme family protein
MAACFVYSVSNMSEFTLVITENLPPATLQAINRVLGLEGGYVNDPNDRGGKTNFGISDLRDGIADGLIDLNLDGIGDIDPKNLTYQQAVSIYYKEYWLANHCHQLPECIAVMVFDIAVNQGSRFACKTLQAVAGVNPDGLIGNKTLSAVNLSSTFYLLMKCTHLRLARYIALVKKDESQLMYLQGWNNRAFEVFEHCQAIAVFGAGSMQCKGVIE